MSKINSVVLLAPYGSMNFKVLATKVGVEGGKMPGSPPPPPPPPPPFNDEPFSPPPAV